MTMYDGGAATSIKTLGTVVAHIYESKALSDDICDKAGRVREPMPQFLKHYMIRKYGLKSIALKNLANLAAGVRQESCNSERLRVFGKITGMLDPHGFRENESNLVLVGLRHLYHINEIHFRMEAHPRVALSSVSAATLAAFTCKYYFADEDDIIRVDGAPMLHPEVRAQLAALAAKTEHLSDALSRGASADHSSRTMSCNAHSDEAEVDLDLWLAWLLGEYEESLANAEHYFHGLYPKFDLNKDQTLDLHEFTNLIHHVDPSKDAVHIMEMYNMAIDCTGDGDNISEEAWVFVALHFHLPHPSHRHH